MFSNEVIQVHNKDERLKDIGNKLYSDPDFSDVTLVCADNQHLPAHRAVLCSSSSLLKELLYDSQQQRTFLYLARVQQEDMRTLLQFIYLGNCSLPKNRLGLVGQLAEELQISGFRESLQKYSTELAFGSNSSEIQHNTENDDREELPTIGDGLSDNFQKDEEKMTETLTLQHVDEYLFDNGKTEEANEVSSSISDSITFTKQNYENVSQTESPYELLDRLPLEDNKLINKFENILEIKKNPFDKFIDDRKPKYAKSGKRILKGKAFKVPRTEIPKPDSNGRYNCDTCEYSSQDKHKFRVHKAVKHEGFSFKCSDCDKQYKDRAMLYNHIRSVHEGVWFECKQCNKQFNNIKNYEQHRERTRKCKACEFFSCSIDVQKHFSAEHGYKCFQCTYYATTRAQRNEHTKEAHELQMFSCDRCEYKNKQKYIVKIHTEEKHLGKDYQCGKCEFRGSKHRLQSHNVIDHEPRDFPCKDCSYVGKRSTKLMYHRDTKHPSIDYFCTECNKSFGSTRSYMRHMNDQHKSEPLICDHCSYTGKSKEYLNLHIKRVHMAELKQCSICSFRTKHTSSLEWHDKIQHQGILSDCDKCGQQIKSSQHFRKCGKERFSDKVNIQRSPDDVLGRCKSEECCRKN